jgi:N-acetylglucosamine-6-phosphate deacetylase
VTGAPNYNRSRNFMPYFDLQINGFSGVDFNSDNLDPVRLQSACAQLIAQGVEGILATIITDSLPAMESRLRALVAFRATVPSLHQILRGIHIEGPFLSHVDGYRGAHPADAIRAADESDMQRLLDAAGGLTRLVTLAPEQDPDCRITRMLAGGGIVVSAGHTNAAIEEMRAAIDAGLSMFTHFGNGCPGTLPRHDNILNRVLALREELWFTFIVDGAHIPFFALKNYLDLVGLDRSIIVTDAISASGLGPGTYTLGRNTVTIGSDGIARAPAGHLVGSTVTMQASHANLTSQLGLTESEANRLLYDNPFRALGAHPSRARS